MATWIDWCICLLAAAAVHANGRIGEWTQISGTGGIYSGTWEVHSGTGEAHSGTGEVHSGTGNTFSGSGGTGSLLPLSRRGCEGDAYNTLHNLLGQPSCLGADKVFHLLSGLSTNCMESIIRALGEHYSAVSQTPRDCDCQGTYSLMHYHAGPGDNLHDYHHSCHRDNTAYRQFYDSFFNNYDQGHAQDCRSHHALWKDMYAIREQDHISGHPCQSDVIKHLSWSFSRQADPCTCGVATTTSTIPPTTKTTTTPTTTSTTLPPTTTTTTKATTTTTTTTTTPAPTTTVPATSTIQCDKQAAVFDVAAAVPVTHPNSTLCDPLNGGTDDAFLLTVCNNQAPQTTWSRGVKVSGNCDRIPLYTPLATFLSETFNPVGAISGLFVGCVPDGFKLMLQPCGQAPVIEYIVSGGLFARDPENYYVIQ